MNTLKKYESFEELKADAKASENIEVTKKRYEEFKELVSFFRSKRVEKTILNKNIEK